MDQAQVVVFVLDPIRSKFTRVARLNWSTWHISDFSVFSFDCEFSLDPKSTKKKQNKRNKKKETKTNIQTLTRHISGAISNAFSI